MTAYICIILILSEMLLHAILSWFQPLKVDRIKNNTDTSWHLSSVDYVPGSLLNAGHIYLL